MGSVCRLWDGQQTHESSSIGDKTDNKSQICSLILSAVGSEDRMEGKEGGGDHVRLSRTICLIRIFLFHFTSIHVSFICARVWIFNFHPSFNLFFCITSSFCFKISFQSWFFPPFFWTDTTVLFTFYSFLSLFPSLNIVVFPSVSSICQYPSLYFSSHISYFFLSIFGIYKILILIFLGRSCSFFCSFRFVCLVSLSLHFAIWSPPPQTLTPPAPDRIHMLTIKSPPAPPHLWGNPLAGHLCLSDKEHNRCFTLTPLFLSLWFFFFFFFFVRLSCYSWIQKPDLTLLLTNVWIVCEPACNRCGI